MTLPDLDSLWASAHILVRRYASQEAYIQALDEKLANSASDDVKIPHGTQWTAPVHNTSRDVHDDNSADEDEADEVVDGAGEGAELEAVYWESESTSGNMGKKKKKKKSVHVEDADFSGDQVLANEILFLQDMGWWVIAAHAVPEGEIGRVWEIMKVCILTFSGSLNHNCANYLLKTYCSHRYKASKSFSDAMLNNSLVNPSGHKWVEYDWSQEDFNKWLEEMVEHKGGDFDDHFYWHTLAPNLLRKAKEDELHFRRSKRTYGLAFTNFSERGYEQLKNSRIGDFIEQSTAYADVTAAVLNPENISEEDEERFQETLDQLIAEANRESLEENESDEDRMPAMMDYSDDGMDHSDDKSHSGSGDEGAFTVSDPGETLPAGESMGQDEELLLEL
ncbi:hypothetical protein B0H10DRAFT_2219881 [Mycena sp. CBHHK59/15]|nr:hypothetical protein B0H10DRAFT_2219881 [Mycena sp. CBHHK59/15]